MTRRRWRMWTQREWIEALFVIGVITLLALGTGAALAVLGERIWRLQQ